MIIPSIDFSIICLQFQILICNFAAREKIMDCLMSNMTSLRVALLTITSLIP